MDFQKTTLKNGLRVICVPMPSMESATVQIIVGAGTRHEEKRVNGVAHFLEHMVFKGTKKYPSAQAVSTVVDAIGADINANTDRERTAYFIKAWEKHLGLAFDVLSGFINSPVMNPDEIGREKGVIYEEIAMYDDLPMQKAPDIFEQLLYKGSPLAWDVLGSKKSIMGVKRRDFVKYRRLLYHPQNMVLTVAGKFDQEEVLKLAEKYFGKSGGGKLSKKASHGKAKKANPGGKPEVKLQTKKTEQGHLVLGVRGNPLGHPDRYKELILATILGGGMSSRLFTEIRERRGLAYYVRCYPGHYTDNGYMAARAGVKVDKIDEAIKVILEQFRQVSKRSGKGSITKAEFEKAKEYIKGKLALGLEDTFSASDFFAEQEILEGESKTPEEMMEGIDQVKLSDVQKLAREFFVNNRLNLAIVGPYDDSERFRKLLKL
ncbi:hypothetical protein CMO96_04580 [Candidatus Woesebacteria bacterium]|nr:hypothetical protein [Candidatus Woesebacteria bacterium]